MCNPLNHESEFMRLCASQLHASAYLKLPRRELSQIKAPKGWDIAETYCPQSPKGWDIAETYCEQ